MSTDAPEHRSDGWEDDIKRYIPRGMKCSLWGHDTKDMTRDELIGFVGFLDELATQRARPECRESVQTGQPFLQLIGKVVEVGNLSDFDSQGFVVSILGGGGKITKVMGLTTPECQVVAHEAFGQDIRITIERTR